MIEFLVAEGEKLTFTHTCLLGVCGEATGMLALFDCGKDGLEKL
jgi:hypothetical protein